MSTKCPAPARVACSAASRAVRRQPGLGQERRLEQGHIRVSGQPDQLVGLAGVGRVGDGRAALRHAQPECLHRVVHVAGLDRERPHLQAPRREGGEGPPGTYSRAMRNEYKSTQ